MATTFSYTVKAAIPLPPGVAAAYYDASATVVELTGPATSVSAGMTIGTAASDWSTIFGVIPIGQGNVAYRLRFSPGTNNSSSTGKLVVDRVADGALLTGATNLSSVKWTAIVIGKGPEASKLAL